MRGCGNSSVVLGAYTDISFVNPPFFEESGLCRFDLQSPSTIMFLDLFYLYVYLVFEIQITAFSDLNLKARSVESETLWSSCRSEICSGT